MSLSMTAAHKCLAAVSLAKFDMKDTEIKNSSTIFSGGAIHTESAANISPLTNVTIQVLPAPPCCQPPVSGQAASIGVPQPCGACQRVQGLHQTDYSQQATHLACVCETRWKARGTHVCRVTPCSPSEGR